MEGVGFRSELFAQTCWLVLLDSMHVVTTLKISYNTQNILFFHKTSNFFSCALTCLTLTNFALNNQLENSEKDYLSQNSHRLPPSNLLCCVHICFSYSDHMVEYTNNVPAICAPESSTLNVQHKIFTSNGKVAQT